jgi:hypothetical protein
MGPHFAAVLGETQALPSQQPWQVAGSHVHVPPVHRWPGPHGPPVPQPHWPASHTLLFAPQATQALPALPHAASDGAGWQNPPWQQPVMQLPKPQPVQTPPSQVEGDVHAWQPAPALPHAAFEVPPRQPPSVPQQPPQVAGLHRHRPPEQRRPAPHTGPPPQLQLPALVQVSAEVGSQAVHAPPIAPHDEAAML